MHLAWPTEAALCPGVAPWRLCWDARAEEGSVHQPLAFATPLCRSLPGDLHSRTSPGPHPAGASTPVSGQPRGLHCLHPCPEQPQSRACCVTFLRGGCFQCRLLCSKACSWSRRPCCIFLRHVSGLAWVELRPLSLEGQHLMLRAAGAALPGGGVGPS